MAYLWGAAGSSDSADMLWSTSSSDFDDFDDFEDFEERAQLFTVDLAEPASSGAEMHLVPGSPSRTAIPGAQTICADELQPRCQQRSPPVSPLLAPQSQVPVVLDLSASDGAEPLLAGPTSPTEFVRVAEIYKALSVDNDPQPNLVDARPAQSEAQTSSPGRADQASDTSDVFSVTPPAKFRWCPTCTLLCILSIQHTKNVPAQG